MSNCNHRAGVYHREHPRCASLQSRGCRAIVQSRGSVSSIAAKLDGCEKWTDREGESLERGCPVPAAKSLPMRRTAEQPKALVSF